MSAIVADTAAVERVLASIPDPEFGISIVDLGLIYSVECVDGDVRVIMTLTTPMCPSGSWIQEGVDAALRQMPGVRNVQVELVFEPPWTAAMLSADARRQLGWRDDDAPRSA